MESFEYHEKSDTYRAEFDPAKTTPSSTVVASLAKVLDTGTLDMEPLYDSIDPDALDALTSQRTETDGDVAVRFVVAGHRVSVYSYGRVAISPKSQ